MLSRPNLLCHDMTSLHLCLKLLLRLRSCVTTLFLFVQLFPVSRHEDLCRDNQNTFLSLKYVATLTLLIATRSVHPLSTLYRDLVFLSRPKLLLQLLFCLNNFFHVATDGSIATDILPSVQHFVASQTIFVPN